MKKTAQIITACFIFLFLGLNIVKSQDFTFEKAYKDYTFTYDQYSQSVADYEKAKEFYLKNQTLTLKEEARKKTLAMLKNRDELEKVYLTALRLKVVEVKGLTPGEKSVIFKKIDDEVEWYKAHKESYRESDPLEDLFNKSKESESRYETHTTLTVYDTLFNITLGENIGSRLDHEDIYASIKKEIDDSVSKGQVRIDPFNRWFTDIEDVVRKLKVNEEAGKKEIGKIYTENYTDPESTFTEAVAFFTDSNGLLLQLNGFLKELLTSFNSQLQITQK